MGEVASEPSEIKLEEADKKESEEDGGREAKDSSNKQFKSATHGARIRGSRTGLQQAEAEYEYR